MKNIKKEEKDILTQPFPSINMNSFKKLSITILVHNPYKFKKEGIFYVC